jgi:hypothetical protein
MAAQYSCSFEIYLPVLPRPQGSHGPGGILLRSRLFRGHQSALTRILRLAIAHRIFLEHRPGFIAHSAASRQIADDACLASWVGAGVDEMWPAAVNLVPALEKWPEAAEPNQTVQS